MILHSSALAHIPGIVHGFSQRCSEKPGDWNMSPRFGNPLTALENRRSFLSTLGLSLSSLILPDQVHGKDILFISDPASIQNMQQDSVWGPTDGLLTTLPEVALGIMVADCCCVLLSELQGRCVGACHAGWRGTYEGIVSLMVQKIQKETGIPPHDLVAWISPAISIRNYQVSSDLWTMFADRFGTDFLLVDPWRIGIPDLNRYQLIEAGVRPENIEVCDLCTFDSNLCFSHRSEVRAAGRMLGVIARSEKNPAPPRPRVSTI